MPFPGQGLFVVGVGLGTCAPRAWWCASSRRRCALAGSSLLVAVAQTSAEQQWWFVAGFAGSCGFALVCASDLWLKLLVVAVW